MKEVDYETLRLDVLQRLIDERCIPYKISKKDRETKKTIIDLLKLDDEGKFFFDTTYEKFEGGFIVGIDLRNKKQMSEINKLIEKKDARRLDRFSDNRLQFWSSQKLL